MYKYEKQGMAFRRARKSYTNYNLEEVANKLGKTKVWLSEIENVKKR